MPRPQPPPAPEESHPLAATRVRSDLEESDEGPATQVADWAATHLMPSSLDEDTHHERRPDAPSPRPRPAPQTQRQPPTTTASPAVANADTASASASVSIPAATLLRQVGDTSSAAAGSSLETSQPSIVVQGKAAPDAHTVEGHVHAAPQRAPLSTSQSSIPIELSKMPAAVQAASMGAEAPDQYEKRPSNPYLPKPAPSNRSKLPIREERSDAHMIAIRTGTVINQRYRAEEMIGRGGMGTVYSVRHVNTGERLALKVLHPALAENEAAVERFRTEARAPVWIESEHVVRIVDADVCASIGNVPFMVMELLDGYDLRSELARRGAIPAGEVVLYLAQVARALDKAHQKGIIHRDLKPANMYVQRREDGSPLVKVLDFGIAKLTDDAAKELTVAGQVFGTPWYMAPEQARGALDLVGPATDLWALGLIAFQLLTGRNYWTADGMAALVGQICYEPLTPPTQRAPHLGPLFDMWFQRACHRDPAQRFSSAKEQVNELAQALGVNQMASVTTGSGKRHLDSSLQIRVPGMNTPSPGSSQPQIAPGQANASSLPPSGQVPGTRLPGQSMDGTNAPLYSTRQPVTVKSNPLAAIALGVIVTLVMVGTGIGIWLVVPGETAAPAAPGPAQEQPAVHPPAAEASDSSDQDGSSDQDDGEQDDAASKQDDEDGTDEDGTDEVDAKAKTAPPAATTAPPVAYTPPVGGKKSPPKPKPKPKAAPKAAPKVGNIDF